MRKFTSAILGVALAALFYCSAFAQGTTPGLFPANTFYGGPATGTETLPAPRKIVGADLPNPSGSALGGIESLTCAAHQWLNTISTSGVPACAQPAFSDISGFAAINQGGTGATTALQAIINLLPTASVNGTVAYWNGTNWVLFAGNTSGTQVFSENASGVPAWLTAAGSGTVTSAAIANGIGLTESGTCTITTSGTCTLNVSLTFVANSLSAAVTITNTSSYFPGPSVAQGTGGTWCASGTVTLDDTAGQALWNVKLWDGTTVINSTSTVNASGEPTTAHLSGCISNPAANIRIDVQANVATTSFIEFNISGNSKDSTLSAWRVQ